MRPAVKMPAAMMPAAKMVTVTTTTMTTAAATTVTAFRDSKVCHRQRHGEDNGGNSQSEF